MMTTETTTEISKRCNNYGDRLIELMERLDVYGLKDVSEEEGLEFLEELKREDA